MCVLFIAWQVHPNYPLVIAANRDEYFARSTAALDQWSEVPIIAGRDLGAGGTWFGVGQSGRIAGLTNIRRPDLIQAHKKSRGELTVNYLNGQFTDTEFQQWLLNAAENYNPFNLLWGTQEQLWTFNSLKDEIEPLTAGFHSISNGALDDIWPKMARGTLALKNYINNTKELDTLELLELLRDSTRASVEQLPQTGIPAQYEYLLSSIFIPAAPFPQGLYGTRSSTVLLGTPTQWAMTEQTVNEAGAITNYKQLNQTISSII